MEIAVFNKDMSKGNYHLEVHKDVETRIMNYNHYQLTEREEVDYIM